MEAFFAHLMRCPYFDVFLEAQQNPRNNGLQILLLNFRKRMRAIKSRKGNIEAIAVQVRTALYCRTVFADQFSNGVLGSGHGSDNQLTVF